MKIRYFKREKYIRNTNIDFWKWIKGKGLFVKYINGDTLYKSSYNLTELLSKEKPEGNLTEIYFTNNEIPPIKKMRSPQLKKWYNNS